MESFHFLDHSSIKPCDETVVNVLMEGFHIDLDAYDARIIEFVSGEWRHRAERSSDFKRPYETMRIARIDA